MFSGFDFGTSNCSVGVVENLNSTSSKVASQTKQNTSIIKLLPLDQGKVFMPSTLYAFERELICEYVAQHIPNERLKAGYIDIRKAMLSQAHQVRREHDIRADEQSLFFGHEAFDQYLSMPSEGYFIKSPKSFLGASGLRAEFVNFFQDIVTAMMQAIKERAEQQLGRSITQTVIGRPVNFQGLNAEKSNLQAIDILTISAKRAGFKEVEFLFEPLAAGLDFEATLTQDKTVLVVDIGGGTTDCAMVRMGPSYRDNAERDQDFLGHTGERVGGNDFDIQLAGKALMPLFGMQSTLKNGLPMPTQYFWDAITTNDASSQSVFNSKETELALTQLLMDTNEPLLLERFINLRDNKQNYQTVRISEQVKIALSDSLNHHADLNEIEEALTHPISREDFANAIDRPLAKMTSLMTEAVLQSGCSPDLIYITGGSAKSQVIRHAIQQKFGNLEIVDGDHFGSVAAGLTRWAQKIFS